MELMELVENEPTTRPFQCDWASCGKVRSFSARLVVAINSMARQLTSVDLGTMGC